MAIIIASFRHDLYETALIKAIQWKEIKPIVRFPMAHPDWGLFWSSKIWTAMCDDRRYIVNTRSNQREREPVMISLSMDVSRETSIVIAIQKPLYFGGPAEFNC